MLEAWNDQIAPLDTSVMEQCREYVDNLTKPLGSLAQLEEMAIRIAGITCRKKPARLQKAIVIAAADTAIDSPDNQDHGKKSLAELMLIAGGAAPVSALARELQAPAYVADVGLEQNTEHVAGVMLHKMQNGSQSLQKGDALTQEACAEAIAFGGALAGELAHSGVEALALGEIGARGALAALAVTTAFLGPELSEAMRAQGFTAQSEAWTLAQTEPETVLARYGNASIAMLTGLVLGAAARHMAIVFDNSVTGAAAVAAAAIAPRVKDYVFASAAYPDPLHQLQLQKLGLQEALHYNFTLAQGLGSTLGLSLLDASLDMLNEIRTFGAAGVAVAEDGPGKGRQRKEVL